jgi:YfiH family protein
VTGRAPPERATLLVARVGPARVWCSDARFGSVAEGTGTDSGAPARNRAAVAAAAGLPDPAGWVWLRQVHGARVHIADRVPDVPPEADAVLTPCRGLPLAIVTADCAPVVLANDDALAVVHAGHRGLAAGVIPAAVSALRASGHGDVRAFLGPCIRPGRYEFGADDLAGLVARLGPAVAARTDDGRPALDIPAAVRVVLERVGVTALADSGVCTSASPQYFSHRRDASVGRQVTVAVLP